MTIVDFVYFYKYIDIGQTDIYLEVQFDIDTEKLMKKLQNTTESMYVNDRYIELTEEEINNL